ncbi:MAG: ABC transporter permease, partial [Armatimonadetes bacterium]|nr:ABC transporter permease [Armatimonadota bacterium]
MTAYIARRIAQMLVVILWVSVVSFGLLFLTGDPTEVLLGQAAEVMSQKQIEEFRRAKGLDQPWLMQYASFLGRAVRGDFGESLRHFRPAFEVVWERVGATAQLGLVGLAISVLVGVPLGVLAATKRQSVADTGTMLVALFGQSVPSFWLGIMLIMVFGVYLRVLPISGRGGWEHLVLPGLTLAAFPLARNARLARSSLLEVLGQDYVRTARAKGAAEPTVIYRHALRNALVPIVTVIGLQLGFLLGGSVIVETIFAWPGVGRAIVQAIGNKDFPVVQAGVTLLAVAFVVVNLLIDILYVY